MRIAYGMGLFIAFIPAASCLGQSPPAWKFVLGDTFTIERVNHSQQATNVRDRVLKQSSDATWVYRFTVMKTEPEAATLTIHIENVTVQYPVGAAVLDHKLLEKMKGGSLTIQITPTGKITSFAGYDKLIEQVVEKKDELGKVVRTLWPATLLQQEIEELFAVTPPRFVKPGDRWQRESTLGVPPLGSFALSYQTVFTERDRAGHHRFRSTITARYEPPTQPVDFFRVVKGEFKLNRANWECSFDSDRGRLISLQRELEFQGEATVEVMGMQTPVAINLRQESKARMLRDGK